MIFLFLKWSIPTSQKKKKENIIPAFSFSVSIFLLLIIKTLMQSVTLITGIWKWLAPNNNKENEETWGFVLLLQKFNLVSIGKKKEKHRVTVTCLTSPAICDIYIFKTFKLISMTTEKNWLFGFILLRIIKIGNFLCFWFTILKHENSFN